MDKKRSAFNSVLCIAIISLTLIASCGGGGGGGGGGGTEPSAVIYVKSNASGADDGTSWQNAFTDLQMALSAAKSGNELWVATGTYKPTSDSDRSKSFTLKQGISLYGGFLGTETTRTQRNWDVNKTILSGNIGAPSDTSDNSYHVVVGANSATIDGFTISDGNSTGGVLGGGMYNNTCNPNISNCVIIQNENEGLYNYNSSPTIVDCTFDSNNGPGIRNLQSDPKITNCTFNKNNGGGIRNDISNPEVTGCIFEDNVSDNGGGIYDDGDCASIIKTCFFIGNTAYSDNLYSGQGGGLFTQSRNTKVINCEFEYNDSSNTGGGIYAPNNGASIINCTFSGNTAGVSGGAVFGGPTITNCILWSNTAPVGPEIDPGLSNPILKNSCIKGGYAGPGSIEDLIDEDPMFVTGTLNLQSSSPCINAGDNTAIPSGVTTDISGNPRIMNVTVDMGAYEYQQ